MKSRTRDLRTPAPALALALVIGLSSTDPFAFARVGGPTR